ncbi:MAG: YggT family protein [bacterium]
MHILKIISFAFRIYEFLILIRIILSWVPHNSANPLIYKLYKITDPFLDLFRPLPLQFGGIDFSPIVALIVLGMIERIVFRIFLL